MLHKVHVSFNREDEQASTGGPGGQRPPGGENTMIGF